MQGGLITFNTNLNRFLARSYTSRVVILVIRARPDKEGERCRNRYRVNQDEHTRERLALHFTLRPTYREEEKYMKSVDIELMHSVEDGLKEKLELDSRPDVRRLAAQCSILVVIAGIVVGLIAT